MKKARYIILSIIFFVIAIFIPFLLDHLVFGNSIPSYISNGEWAGFLGSYIGGLCTLIALIATIRYYRNADERKEKAEIQPFLHIVVDEDLNKASRGFSLPGGTEKSEKNLKKVPVIIKNIGNGFANILVIHTGENFGGLGFRRVVAVNESEPFYFMVDTEKLDNGLCFALQFVDSMRNEYIQEYEMKKEGSHIIIECEYPHFMEKRK